MRKGLLTIGVLFAALGLSARTLYLAPGVWNTDGAKFAIYYFNGSSDNGWSAFMSSVDANTFKADIPDAYTTVIFVRLNSSASAPDWNARWNQTDDLTISGDNNLFTISDWGGDKSPGEWSVYGQQGGGDNPGGGGGTPVDPKDYETAVPSQCTDVMLQAFYWDSNTDKGFGNTQWNTLNGQVDEIGQYFTLVWLPPSGYPNAYTSSKLGYIPQRYSYQTSNMGMVGALKTLIQNLHNKGVRVLADIVINHCGNHSNSCDFDEQDFGSFGKFSPTSKWITSNDEGQCDKGSNADDGQHEANYGAARDWDHKNSQVQAMCRAYLKWMKAEMKYDGFRFDYCGGYHVSHINDYVSSAKPYFSVMEYWDGDASALKARIDDASRNTLAFDFANMYTAFRDGIAKNSYGNLINSGMRGKGYSKYAVTFIDNHDTFARGADGVTDICGKGDGSSINNSSVMLQCNAYMLSMPGVPCVFYPHWVKYKTEIKKMIHARRMAGIHSESEVQETSGSGWYEATITGKYGQVVLYLGSSASKAAPDGFNEGAKGTNYAMYFTGEGPDAIDIVTGAQIPELDVNLPMYNIMGQQVDAAYHGIVIQNGYKYLLQ